MKNTFADNKRKILSNILMLVFAEMRITYLTSLKKLSGSGRYDSGIPVPGVTVEKQKKKTKWMLTPSDCLSLWF